MNSPRSCHRRAFLGGLSGLALLPAQVARADYPSTVQQIDRLPKPRPDAPVISDPQVLFTIHGSIDTNTIVYAMSQDSGEEPVSVYWRRFTSGGIRQPLSFLEKRFAYGVETTGPDVDGTLTVRVTSYAERPISVKAGADGKYVATIAMGEATVQLAFVFLTFDNTGLVPRVVSADVYGRDTRTGRFMREHFFVSSP